MPDFQKVAKRCICGQSARMPLCDGSHTAKGWRCDAPGVDKVDQVFAASPYLRNLADRLAWEMDGLSLHMIEGEVRCVRLILISDGHGMAAWDVQSRRVDADEVLILGVGPAARRLTEVYPKATFIKVPEEPLDSLWSAVIAAIAHEPVDEIMAPLPRIFLSHAVADEAALYPVIERLRQHLAADVFVCADSIDPGVDWQAVIRRELRERDLFLFIATEASKASLFCAFEAGVATALEKTIRIVSLDGTPPPAHLQNIQSMDAVRLRTRKPWLRPTEAVYEACLIAIQGGAPARV